MSTRGGGRDGFASGRVEASAVRERLSFSELAAKDGVVVRKQGRSLVAHCPFHEERSGSFVIGGRDAGRAKCFGCGWGGDIFDYWMARHGGSFSEAVEALGSLVGLVAPLEGVRWARPKAKPISRESQAPIGERERPFLPPMRELTGPEMRALAELRGVSLPAVQLACREFEVVKFCEWPLWRNRRTGEWRSPCAVHGWRCSRRRSEGCSPREVFPSWAVSDRSGHVAEFRRMDGERYSLGTGTGSGTGRVGLNAEGAENAEEERREGDDVAGVSGSGCAVLDTEAAEERKGIKAWSTAGKNWPVGLSELGSRPAVLLVEGGPDLLAGFHFLHGFGMLSQVCPVAMLGASARISDEALPFFRGKRVRIMMDADVGKGSGASCEDEVTPQRGEEEQRDEVFLPPAGVKCPGLEAAARWCAQLTAAGAVVETFSLYGLTRADGAPVKDVNDLALCSADVVGSAEVEEAFVDWDF